MPDRVIPVSFPPVSHVTMSQAPRRCALRPLRSVKRAAIVVAIATVISTAAFLPFAGRYLAVNEPLERGDAIFVLAGARVERWLEGVDLHHENWAPRIVLSPGREEPAEEQLRSRGVRLPAEIELVRNAMIELKVPPDVVMALPEAVDNTAQEAIAIRAMIEREGWKTLIVVTSVYHSRRTQVAFRREFRHSPVKIIVRAARYDPATPRRWWTRRDDIRQVASELQKLLVYRLGVRG
jgi:uncharacterized SAM-binding protein YcdF (DUF218 family)